MTKYAPAPVADMANATNCALALRSKESLRTYIGIQARLVNIKEEPINENQFFIKFLNNDKCFFIYLHSSDWYHFDSKINN